MTQIRAVIRGTSVTKLNAILEYTGLSTPSEAISVLISRYGQSLIDGWEISGELKPAAPQVCPVPTIQAQTPTIDYSQEISL